MPDIASNQLYSDSMLVLLAPTGDFSPVGGAQPLVAASKVFPAEHSTNYNSTWDRAGLRICRNVEVMLVVSDHCLPPSGAAVVVWSCCSPNPNYNVWCPAPDQPTSTRQTTPTTSQPDIFVSQPDICMHSSRNIRYALSAERYSGMFPI